MKLFKANLIDSLSCFKYESHADAGDLKVWIESDCQQIIKVVTFDGDMAGFFSENCCVCTVGTGSIVVRDNGGLISYTQRDFAVYYNKEEAAKKLTQLNQKELKKLHHIDEFGLYC